MYELLGRKLFPVRRLIRPITRLCQPMARAPSHTDRCATMAQNPAQNYLPPRHLCLPQTIMLLALQSVRRPPMLAHRRLLAISPPVPAWVWTMTDLFPFSPVKRTDRLPIMRTRMQVDPAPRNLIRLSRHRHILRTRQHTTVGMVPPVDLKNT